MVSLEEIKKGLETVKAMGTGSSIIFSHREAAVLLSALPPCDGVGVKPLDDDQIMEIIREVAPWKDEPKLNDLLTYEKSPPLFPQATYDVPSYRAEKFVRAVEKRILSALTAVPADEDAAKAGAVPAAVERGATKQEKLGRFNWHSDPAIDFEVEVGDIEAEIYNHKTGFENGTPPLAELMERIARAMTFRVGAVETCVAAKARLRELEKEAKALSSPPPSIDGATEALPQWVLDLFQALIECERGDIPDNTLRNYRSVRRTVQAIRSHEDAGG